MNCNITPLPSTHPPPHFPFLPTTVPWQQRRRYTVCTACTAVHTLLQAFCQNVQRTQPQTKKLLWMFIMYRFFFPYSRDYILRGSGASEMDCGVCIFADRRRRRRMRRRLFSDVSARCTVFMGLHYNPFASVLFFSSRNCIREVMQTLG